MLRHRSLILCGFAWASLALGWLAQPAAAHFLWLVVEGDAPPVAHVYFSETPTPDDPTILDRILGVEVWQQAPTGEAQKLASARGTESIEARPLRPLAEGPVFGLNLKYGVVTRDEQTFLLMYYAKALTTPLAAAGPADAPTAGSGSAPQAEAADSVPSEGQPAPAAASAERQPADSATDRPAGDNDRNGQPRFDAYRLPLQIDASRTATELIVVVRFQGRPIEGAQITISGPDFEEELLGVSDAAGQVRLTLRKNGRYGVLARHIEPTAGVLAEQRYDSIRHYSTLTLSVEDIPPAAPTP